MNVGKLNRRIKLYKNDPEKNEYNEIQDIVSPDNYIKETWASVKPLKGREFWQAAQFNSEVTVKVTIRYMSGVQNGYVVLCGDRRLTVQYGIPDDNNRYLVLYCKE